MSVKKEVTDRMVKELYQVMSSEHFARLSGVFWKLLNEWQQAKASSGGEMEVLEARIEQMEQTLGRLQTKLEALEELLAKKKSPPRGKSRKKQAAKTKKT